MTLLGETSENKSELTLKIEPRDSQLEYRDSLMFQASSEDNKRVKFR
jgi:hypothetical protein